MTPGRMGGVMWLDIGLHALFLIVVVVLFLRS
jgi:hypothetical protein